MGLFNKNSVQAQELGQSSSNIIGKGTTIIGDIESAGNLRIDGKLRGNIKCKAKVALGEGSIVEGNIIAQNAEIQGEVQGIIEVTELLILKPSAKVIGDILTSRLIVEDGAIFMGNCKMGNRAQATSQAHLNGSHDKERKPATVQ
ncbi:MAG: polymer-forming cytoskeletal protein [Cytophagales bacterium]|nr:polymer-forming cytoskeletal protein [Cytophagales bacterium]MDW8383291.1 polymer-forming cytoskeletal protein [Flammeovirgaceae bacterium]